MRALHAAGSRSCSTSSTTTPARAASTARRCPGAAWTTPPTTGSTRTAALRRHHRLRQHAWTSAHPRVVQLTLDSLRYWVEEMHVDGFRFDLAPTLGPRRPTASTPTTRSSSRSRADPVLCAGQARSPSRGTSAPAAGAPGSSRRRSRSGTTASATACATSGSPAAGRWHAGHRAAACATSPPGWPGSADVFAARAAGRSRRSTSSPPTTASRCADLVAYDAQAQRGQRRGQPRRQRRQPLVEPRRRGRTTPDPAVLAAARGARCATCSPPCCSRPACR